MADRTTRENDILARCIREDASGELERGEARITEIEKHVRCLRRAVWLMAFTAAAGCAGLAYSAILLHRWPPYETRIINHLFSVLGLGALLSFVIFGGMWLAARGRLANAREELRHITLKILAERSQIDREQAGRRAA